MRNIEFRCYDERNDDMVYSSVESSFYIDSEGVFFMYAIPLSQTGLSKDRQYHKDYNVEQFTGLKDSKGVKIFDGDIIKSGMTGATYVVVWENFSWMKRLIGHHRVVRIEQDSSHDFLIGNIHKNLELLGDK